MISRHVKLKRKVNLKRQHLKNVKQGKQATPCLQHTSSKHETMFYMFQGFVKNAADKK